VREVDISTPQEMCSIEKHLKLETGWIKRVDNFGRDQGPLWTVMSNEEKEEEEEEEESLK